MRGKPLHAQKAIEALSSAAFGWKQYQQQARQEDR